MKFLGWWKNGPGKKNKNHKEGDEGEKHAGPREKSMKWNEDHRERQQPKSKPAKKKPPKNKK